MGRSCGGEVSEGDNGVGGVGAERRNGIAVQEKVIGDQ